MRINIPVEHRFQNYQNLASSGIWRSGLRQLSKLTKILSIAKVDIPVGLRVQNYQHSVIFKSCHSCSFHSYLTLGRLYASCQMSELIKVAFRATKIVLTVGAGVPVDCGFQSYQNLANSTDKVENHSFQSYLKLGRC